MFYSSGRTDRDLAFAMCERRPCQVIQKTTALQYAQAADWTFIPHPFIYIKPSTRFCLIFFSFRYICSHTLAATTKIPA